MSSRNPTPLSSSDVRDSILDQLGSKSLDVSALTAQINKAYRKKGLYTTFKVVDAVVSSMISQEKIKRDGSKVRKV